MKLINNIKSIINKTIYDITIVGSGIVGLTTGRELLIRNPKLKILVLDKEDEIAKHQSSHNSGVIHCGIYYKPGSIKQRLCLKGSKLMYDYCNENQVPYENCGKLIVAVDQNEFQSLDQLYKRGIENGVPNIRMIDNKDEIQSIEPYILGGLRAIHTPSTGIVDYKQVCKSVANDITEKYGKDSGSTIKLNFEADQFDYSSTDKIVAISEKKTGETILSKHVIVCAGMNSDRVALKAYGDKEPSIVPFRGTFLQFKPEYRHLIRGNVYPLPNPAFPFLGVHFTKRINGEIWLGPNAVLAFHREGYKFTDFNLRDFTEIISNPGLFQLTKKHWKYGLNELHRDIFPSNFIPLLKPYMPNITSDMLEFGGSGVRSQAIASDGQLIEDFIFDIPNGLPILHVRNTPSPAATSSFAIAIEIVNMVESNFNIIK